MAREKREIWAADCETDPFKHGRMPRPFIWGCYNGTEYHEFKTTSEFMEFITARKAIVYAHNGGRFDWHFVLDHLEPFTELTVIAGRIAKFKIDDCEFRDSYNILPIPLAAYQKDEFDYTMLEEEVRHLHMPAIRKYLKSDCLHLFNIVDDFINKYGLNLTVASTAMKFWVKQSNIETPKSTAAFYEQFAPYYYGGRVQVFKAGIHKKPFKLADINSAYPFAMVHDHPFGTISEESEELPAGRKKIQRCFIEIRCESRGAFPYRDGGLTFPDDGLIRTFTVTGWEFLAALDTGCLSDYDIISVKRFLGKITFKNYVDHFYQLKNEAKAADNKADYLFSKLFLNSLYGKFAANPDKYKNFIVVDKRNIIAAEQRGWDYAGVLNKWAIMNSDLDEYAKNYYNVATAASITGFVRAQLWRAIKSCKGVIYCDTDSVFCEDTASLPMSDKLGAWDIEAHCTEGAFCGKKLYAIKKEDGTFKVASKGGKLTGAEVYKIAHGETVRYKSEAPTFSVRRENSFIERDFRSTA